MCLCVCLLKRAYFWSSMFLVRIRYGSSRNTYAPTCTWLFRRMIVVRSCDKFSGLCICKFEKNRIFRTFYLVDDGYAFIIVFGAVDPVVNNIEDFPSNSIKQAAFHCLNPFRRMVIH